MNTGSISAYISDHWRELLLVLVPIILIRVVRMVTARARRQKEIKKEKEQADRLRRDEALNEEILNPERRPGDVVEQKHPYKVEYSEKGLDTARSAAAGDPEGAGMAGRRAGTAAPAHRQTAGARLKVTEYSGLSRRSYMYRNDETMRVGSMYGKTGILAGDSGDSILYFEIYPKNNLFYIRSAGGAKTMISRGKNRREVGSTGLLLYENDRITVMDRVYDISFV